MEVTKEQYTELKEMLNSIGVEVRMTIYHGDTKLIGIQVRNDYKDNCILYSNLTGKEIADNSKKEIIDGRWSKN